MISFSTDLTEKGLAESASCSDIDEIFDRSSLNSTNPNPNQSAVRDKRESENGQVCCHETKIKLDEDANCQMFSDIGYTCVENQNCNRKNGGPRTDLTTQSIAESATCTNDEDTKGKSLLESWGITFLPD